MDKYLLELDLALQQLGRVGMIVLEFGYSLGRFSGYLVYLDQ